MEEYKEETIKTLQDLGFKHVTHVMWRHDKSGIMMAVATRNEPSDLPDVLIRLGEKIRAKKIRELL